MATCIVVRTLIVGFYLGKIFNEEGWMGLEWLLFLTSLLLLRYETCELA